MREEKGSWPQKSTFCSSDMFSVLKFKRSFPAMKLYLRSICNKLLFAFLSIFKKVKTRNFWQDTFWKKWACRNKQTKVINSARLNLPPPRLSVHFLSKVSIAPIIHHPRLFLNSLKQIRNNKNCSRNKNLFVI